MTFKIACEPRELEQVHALHYKAFVQEIPQHAPNTEERHVDRFHDQNVYVVALEGEAVIGSLALRAERPWSLDQKLPDLDSYLPANRQFCEVRLLNIARDHRHGRVLPGMLSVVWDYAMSKNLDGALISATTRQLKLYGHLGFVPFGPLVGTDEAPFQPMYCTVEAFQQHAHEITSLPPSARGEIVNLLAGPVAIHPDVVESFQTTPASHRAPAFDHDLHAAKASLRELAGKKQVEILLGSGTLANDAIAAQLSTLGGRGLVISNGEFGERLADHAGRAQLDFEHIRFDWGAPFDLETVHRTARNAGPAWLWVVACETSAGILNDVTALAGICRETGARLCVDAVSALGAVPLDLAGVWLASGASGKALAAYPGLSMVFHDHAIEPVRTLPRYLDLGLYAGDGVPFTHSSNLVRALGTAVSRVDWPVRLGQVAASGAWLRSRLLATGFTLVGGNASPAPHVITIELPRRTPSLTVGRALERAGFLLGYESGYLSQRNWIQICLMGEIQRETLPILLRELGRVAH